MSKPSPRKQKKQKERERQNRTKKLAFDKRWLVHARKAEYSLKYPGFRFDTTNGDPALVELVKNAVAQINFEDESVFLPWEAQIYRIIKQGGWNAGEAALKQMLAEAKQQGVEGTEKGEVTFSVHLGQVVFDLIGEAELEKYLPFNDVAFAYRGGDVFGRFDSLLHAKGTGGTVYYSRKKPTIEIDGEKKIVAFSRHAIDQTCNRIKPNRKTYAAVGDLFGFFSYCVYFERCDLDRGQLGFTFYDRCGKAPFWQRHYVTAVLGEENIVPGMGECYYRVGYCPAIIEGDFIKAKTLLYPGFAATPEYGAIQRSSLSRQEKQEMIEKVKHLDADYLIRDGLGLIKWFHDNGVPQVVQLRQPVFDYK
jgi:hypothetical protein